jgi:hypothetical protein
VWQESTHCVGIRGDVGSATVEAVVRCRGREKTARIEHDVEPGIGKLLEIALMRR